MILRFFFSRPAGAFRADPVIFHAAVLDVESRLFFYGFRINVHLSFKILDASADRADKVQMGRQIGFMPVVHNLKIKDLYETQADESLQRIVDGGQTQPWIFLSGFEIDLPGAGVGVGGGQIVQNGLSLPGYAAPRCAKGFLHMFYVAGDKQSPQTNILEWF